MRTIVITGAPPVQVLDVAGPLEVFASHPEYRVLLGNPEAGSALRTHRGLSLQGAIALSQLAGPIDTLLIVGGTGSESGSFDDVFIQWIRDAAARSRRIASICTGVFALAAAGLLDGRKAVTHWKYCQKLANDFPLIKVETDPIFVKDGAVYSSAGITAGIDLSLALVEEDLGHQAALTVARQLVMFLVRPGGQAQYSQMLSHQTSALQPLRELQVWVSQHLRDRLTVETLAERIGMSPRHFTRVCTKDTGLSPGQFVERLRVEEAQRLMDSSSLGQKEIADACGFRTADAMRRTFLRVLGVSPAIYRRRFQRGTIAS